MADSTLNIYINALVRGLAEVGEMSNKVREAAGSTEQLNQTTKKGAPANAELSESVKALGEGYRSLTSHVNTAIKAFIGFLAIKGAKELADYAARTETLGITLSIVGKNAGYSQESLSQYEVSLKKLGITTQAAREAMTKMIQAGLPLGPMAEGSASNVERLARASQDLAVVSGQNSSVTFQKLITNIQQMDTIGLRYMGITVNMVAAQEAFATSLGKSASALTQQQKIQAANNAVLAEAEKLQGSYEASLGTVGKRMQSMKRYQEELAEVLGQKLLPAYAAIVDSTTNLLEALTSIAADTEKSKIASEEYGAALGQLADTLGELIKFIAEFAAANIDVLGSISVNIVGLATDLLQLVASLMRASGETDVLGAALWTFGLLVAGLRDGLRVLYAVVLELGVSFLVVTRDIINAVAALFGMIPGLKSLAVALRGIADGLDGAAVASHEAAGQIMTDFANGNTATKKFMDGVHDANIAVTDFGKATNISEVVKEFELLADATKKNALSSSDMKAAGDKLVSNLEKMYLAGKLTKEEFVGLVDTSVLLGAQLPEGFKSGADALDTLQKKIEAAKVTFMDFGKGTSFEAIEEEVRKLTEAQRLNTLSSVEQKKAIDLVTASIKKFGEAGGEVKQVNTLMAGLATVTSTMGKEMEQAYKNIGSSASELASGVSVKFSEMSSGMIALGAAAEVTGEQFLEAFAGKIDSAQTISELSLMGDAIDELRKKSENLFVVDEFVAAEEALKAAGEAASLAALKFDKLFEASLKSAKTSADYDKLTADVEKVGKQVGLTTEEVEKYIAQLERQKAILPEIAAAYDALGIKSQSALKTISESVEKQYETLKKSGASVSELDQAWKKYAEAAIAANNGVASSTLRAEAGMRGYRIEVDSVGKATVVAMKNASDGMRLLENLVPGITAAYEKLGLKSQQALEQQRDELKKAYDLLVLSGAGVDALRAGWLVYAEAAIAANNGVADSTIQAEAETNGYIHTVDTLGKSHLKAAEAAKDGMEVAAEHTSRIQENNTALMAQADANLAVAQTTGDATLIQQAQIEVARVAAQAARDTAAAKWAEAQAAYAAGDASAYQKGQQALAADAAVKTAEAGLKALEQVSRGIGRVSVISNESIAKSAGIAADAVWAVGAAYEKVELKFAAGVYSAEQVWGKIGKYFESVIEWSSRLAGAQDQVDVLMDSLSDSVGATEFAINKAKAALTPMDDLTARVHNSVVILGDERLEPLRAAIKDAEDRMQALRDTSKSALEAIQDEWDQLNGRLEDIEKRRAEKRRAELEAQLDAAKAAKDSVAIADLEKALRLLGEVNRANINSAKSREQEAAAAAKAAAAKAATDKASLAAQTSSIKNNEIIIGQQETLSGITKGSNVVPIRESSTSASSGTINPGVAAAGAGGGYVINVNGIMTASANDLARMIKPELDRITRLKS